MMATEDGIPRFTLQRRYGTTFMHGRGAEGTMVLWAAARVTPVVSHSEVATRGRSLSLALVSIGGTTIRARWVAP
jgi:hypothetical protein